MRPARLVIVAFAGCAADEYGDYDSTHDDSNHTSTYDVYSYDYDAYSYSDTMSAPVCSDDSRGDLECDHECNMAQYGFDDGDCFHDDPGCYVHPTGADYRGNVNVTKSGYACQLWSAQYPRPHTYFSSHYPDSNLGGHNSCRNPSSYDGSTGPWCLIASEDDAVPIWEYCDVGPASKTPCAAPNPLKPKTHKQLQLDKWLSDSVYEHRYQYYNITLPPKLTGFQVVVVPLSGQPVLYVSFDQPFTTGHDATYRQDTEGVEVFYMTSKTYGYCAPALAAQYGSYGEYDYSEEGSEPSTPEVSSPEDGCTLYLSVSAHETSDFQLVVYDTAGSTTCSAGCAWNQLGDGECQPSCNNEACFGDLGDCARNPTSGGCHAACKEEWINDGYCDPACFNMKCNFDGDDCGGKGCSDGCMKKHRGNGVCDAACNVEACHWDGGDCFHAHTECYTEANGKDYRGTISHTRTGKVCQYWSEQTPNVHQFEAQKWPKAGVGGHNFCRNPDASEQSPWCYVSAEGGPRFETCEVGAASETPCPLPPPPPPRSAIRSGAAHHKTSEADVIAGLVVPAQAGQAETLGIGVLIGGSVACLIALIALAALAKNRLLLAKSGMYSFGTPPSAEEEDEKA